MSNHPFLVKFRGVRGGYPMPGPSTLKYGGNTTCLEVRAGGHLIIFDAGTGIIDLGKEMMQAYQADGVPLRATMLMTHFHMDHVQGLTFFTPILNAACQLHFFGPQPYETTTMEAAINQVFIPPYASLRLEELLSQRHFTHVRGGDRILLTDPGSPPRYLTIYEDKEPVPDDAVMISIHRGYNHPRNGILVYRIDYRGHSLVFATDVEGYVGGDRKLINFARDADLLVHDAEYDEADYADGTTIKQGWGHSTWRMATDIAQAANVKYLALTHHSPMHDDTYLEAMERKAQAHFPATFMAQEGKVMDLMDT